MSTIFSNASLKLRLKNFLISEIAEYNKLYLPLVLNIVLIGDNLSSIKYVNLKQKLGAELGVKVVIHKFSGQEEDIHFKIQSLLKVIELSKLESSSYQGIIFQLPLAQEFAKYIEQVPVFSDVDLLSNNWPNLLNKNIFWPTVQAIQLCLYEIINSKSAVQKTEETSKSSQISEFDSKTNLVVDEKIIPDKINLKGKTVAVVGQGKLVGSPTLNWLAKTEATIISINKDTKNPETLTKQADIVISGVGVPNLINSSWLKDDAIVIDAGTSDVEGSLIGDVDKNNLSENVVLCPSPGGIGPLTVLCLFWNLLKLAQYVSERE